MATYGGREYMDEREEEGKWRKRVNGGKGGRG